MTNKLYDRVKNYIKENKLFLSLLVLIVVVFSFPLPYVIEAPGGVIMIDERIEADTPYEASGAFGMAYVSMIKGTVPSLILSLFNKNWEVNKASDITYDDETISEMDKRERYDLEESISKATITAYNYANKEVKIKNQRLVVVYLDEEAKTDIKLYDEIVRVNGEEVKTIDDVKKIVSSLDESIDTINIEVLRNGKLLTCKAELYDTSDGRKIGILSSTHYELETNPRIEIATKDNESGPSGGFITALSIYNHLVEEDITGGKKIIGTGTIDENGKVGEIGGVKYKLLGAEKDKWDLFIVPKENYEEALNVKKEYKLKIKIVAVGTFEEAIKSLQELIK